MFSCDEWIERSAAFEPFINQGEPQVAMSMVMNAGWLQEVTAEYGSVAVLPQPALDKERIEQKLPLLEKSQHTQSCLLSQP